MAQFSGELKDPSSADGGHSDPPAAALNLGVSVFRDPPCSERPLDSHVILHYRLCFEVDKLLDELCRRVWRSGFIGLREKGR